MTALILLLLLPAPARAGAFEVAQQGAETAGTAHAGVGLRGRSESAWFNPAALTDDFGLRVTAGVALAHARIRATSLDGAPGEPWEEVSDTPLGTPPWLYLSYARAKWALSISANAPFAGGIRWPSDGPLRFETVLSKPQFFRVAPAFAWRFGPVAIGAGPHVDVGSLRIERATDHVVDEGYATISLRGYGVGGDAFLHVHASPTVSLGLSYRSRTALRLAGEADFDLPPAFASRAPDSEAEAAWTLPDRLALGVAWRSERWLFTSEADLTLWSVNQSLNINLTAPGTTDLSTTNAWRSTVALRAGVAVDAHALATVRLGAVVDGLTGAAPPPAWLGPSSPDGTRVAGTVGVGLRPHRQLQVDLWAEPMVVLRRSSTSTDLPPASYGGWAFVGGLGLTATAPRRAALHVGAPELDPSPVPDLPPGATQPPPSPVWGDAPPPDPKPAEGGPIWTPKPKQHHGQHR